MEFLRPELAVHMSRGHSSSEGRQFADCYQLITSVGQFGDQHLRRIRRRSVNIVHQNNISVLYLA